MESAPGLPSLILFQKAFIFSTVSHVHVETNLKNSWYNKPWCWNSVKGDKNTRFNLLSTHFPLLTAEKGWLSALCYQSSICFVLFYLQLFILLLTQLASEYRLAEYTALFSSRSGCIQA